MMIPSAKRWHRIRERAGMPLLGGVRPPIAVLAALLLVLSGLTALGLGRTAPGLSDAEALPEAVRLSQQHFAEDGAIALRASLDESITDLERTASLFNAGGPVTADTVLDKLGSVYQKWRGSSVVEIKSGKLLAARGENVPLLAVDLESLSDEGGLAPRLIRLENGETRLLILALLSWDGLPQQLLITSNSLNVPGVSLGKFRAIAVADAGGTVLSSDGPQTPEEDDADTPDVGVGRTEEQLRVLAERSAGTAGQNPLTTREPGSGGYPGVSGSTTGSTLIGGERPVAGYAALAAPETGGSTDATGLGLFVITMVTVPENTSRTGDPLFGLWSAAALLVTGALAVALLLGTVQRPLLRLVVESRRLTRGDLTRPVTVPRFGETRRIGDALERLRLQLPGGPTPGGGTGARTGTGTSTDTCTRTSTGGTGGTGTGKRLHGRRVGARALLAGGGILLLIWSAPMMLLLNRAGDTAVVPQQLVNDQRDRTDTVTDRVRRALNEGHADLRSVATLIGDRTAPADMAKVLERTRTEHPRYRSLYVLSADGSVLATAGDNPRHPGGKRTGTEPITVLGEGSKEPRITGYAELPGRDGASVVGEFRIDFLNSLLKRPGLGQIRIVDAERRTVGSNTGYRAFQKLPSSRLDSLVEATGQKVGLGTRPSGVLFRDSDSDRILIAAAAPFAGGGAAKSLGWTVVSWQPASALAIPEYSAQNRTVLAGLLGVTAAAACLGWLHIVVVRPLRELAKQAETLADGDRRTVLYPRHHDEVGAIARSLELLRQQLQEQRRREGAPPALADRTPGPPALSHARPVPS
ncbi:HAMP domain-containing protein [Streptomyces sp. NPDC088551]|uniref:HAMP domain-containing protein n=1 Tax=Streptomyces sp. NPDC088551 TaxID=3365863 RepID=UPI00381DCCBF